jgi:hypothetical protein
VRPYAKRILPTVFSVTLVSTSHFPTAKARDDRLYDYKYTIIRFFLKNCPHLTTFQWVAEAPTNGCRGIFAQSVREFAHAKSVILKSSANVDVRGRRPWPTHPKVPNQAGESWYAIVRWGQTIMSLNCRFFHMNSTLYLSIWLKNIGSLHFRVKPDQLPILDERTQSARDKTQLLYIVSNVDEAEERERGSGSSHSQATSRYWPLITLARPPASRNLTEG